MVPQRVYGPAEAISYHKPTEKVFPPLVWSSSIRRWVSCPSVPADQGRHVYHRERFHVPIWSEPWCGHHPLTLHDRNMHRHVGRCCLGILHHSHTNRHCLLVVRVGCRRLLIVLYHPFLPLLCPSLIIPALFSPAVNLLSLIYCIDLECIAYMSPRLMYHGDPFYLPCSVSDSVRFHRDRSDVGNGGLGRLWGSFSLFWGAIWPECGGV